MTSSLDKIDKESEVMFAREETVILNVGGIKVRLKQYI